MWIVIGQRKVVIHKRKQILHLIVERHRRQRRRGTLELFMSLIEMIGVQVGVAKGMDELPWL